MKLVTVATHKERYFPYLEQSAKRYGHDLVVLGWGQKWQGYTWKFQLMNDYLAKLGDDEIVCFTDAYDVIVLEGPDEIERKFKAMVGNRKDQIVVSEDRSNHKGMLYLMTNKLCFHDCYGHYINSGTYIGYAAGIRTLFSKMCSVFKCNADSNDQALLQQYCQKSPETYHVDKGSEIFLVICDLFNPVDLKTESLSIKDGRLSYKGVFPSIFHATGNANIDDILVKLGYDLSGYSASSEDKIAYIMKYVGHFAKGLFLQYLKQIILVAFIVYLYFYQRARVRSVLRSVQRTLKSHWR
jgi:hypothetical protein